MPSSLSSSVIPCSSCLQSFPASGYFLMSQLFASGGQSIGASASVLPINIQDWFPLGLTSLTSLQSKGLSRVFSNTTVQKHQFSSAQPSLWSHIHAWLLGKSIVLSRRTFVSKVMSLPFNMLSRFGFPGGSVGKELACQFRRCKKHRLDPWVGKIPWRRKWQSTPVFLLGKLHGQRSLVGHNWVRHESVFRLRFVIAFHPRRKHLQFHDCSSPFTMILEPKKIKSATVSIVSPSIWHEVIGPVVMILVFWTLRFKPLRFYSPLSLSSRGSLVLHFLP